MRQEQKRRAHNRQLRSKMRTLVRKVQTAENKEEGEKHLNSAISYLDRMAVKGIIHKNNAANKKSQLVTYVNNL